MALRDLADGLQQTRPEQRDRQPARSAAGQSQSSVPSVSHVF